MDLVRLVLLVVVWVDLVPHLVSFFNYIKYETLNSGLSGPVAGVGGPMGAQMRPPMGAPGGRGYGRGY